MLTAALPVLGASEDPPAPATTSVAADSDIQALHTKYRQLLVQYPNDPGLKAFDDRLKCVEKIASAISARIREVRRESLGGLLDVSAAPKRNAKGPTTLAAAPNTSELLSESATAIASGLPAPQLDTATVQFLRDYYEARQQQLTDEICKTAWNSRVAEADAMAEICCLAIILPFLNTQDDQWTYQQVSRLPDWMHKDDSIRALKRFALTQDRLQTAYQFQQYTVSKFTPATLPSNFRVFLVTTADELVAQRDYRAAVACYRRAIALAEGEKNVSGVVDTACSLADLLDRTGHPSLAAEEMGQIAHRYPTSDQVGKVVMLRMKYLYGAGQYSQVIEECPGYEANPLCQPYRPQLLYLRWVTHRRVDQAALAQKVQDTFLKDYPEHPLAADMYFSSAMSALAASNYTETLRLLEIVEYRFPTYKGMDKVKEIRSRLQAMSKTEGK